MSYNHPNIDFSLKRPFLEFSGDRLLETVEHKFLSDTLDVDKTYALVWTQQILDLGLRIHGHDEEMLLWRASHRASRGDGGLPLSPISLGTALFSAGRAHNDHGTVPSMVDDSFRRMLKKFPDTRHY